MANRPSAGNREAIVLRRETTPAARRTPLSDKTASAQGVEPERGPLPELNASGFGFVCHVARKGDVGSAGGGWVGGPGAPSVIEGIALHWNAPPGLELEYQVLASGAEDRWSAWVAAGVYAGTRGRGLPIVGLRVRIAGNSSKRFRLLGEAIFLGLPPVVEAGDRLDLTGCAGVDPLVGLRLDLLPVDEAAAERSDGPKTLPQQEEKKSALRRLQIFRSMRAEERTV